MKITKNEKKDLIAFLLTLTDKEFLFNPRYSYPNNKTKTNQYNEK